MHDTDTEKKLVGIIREDLGKNVSEVFHDFYAGFSEKEQVRGAFEVLSEIIGSERASIRLKRYFPEVVSILVEERNGVLVEAKTKLFPKILLFLFLASTAFYVFRIGGSINGSITGLLYLVPIILMVATSWLAFQTYGIRHPQGKALLFFFLSFSSLLTGQLVWFVLRSIFNVNPFPSLADLFYILGYFFAFIATILEVRIQRVKWKKIDPLVLASILIGAILFGGAIFYFEVYLAYKPAYPFFDNFFAMIYGILDIFLLAIILFILRLAANYEGGTFFRGWLSVFISEGMILIGDLLFALNAKSFANNVWPYSLIAVFWLGANFLLAYGFYYMWDSIHNVKLALSHSKK